MLIPSSAAGPKPLFTILCQRRSPARFLKARGQRIETALTKRREWYRERGLLSFDEAEELRRLEQDEVGYHRLDDLVGFAEIYWDGGSRIKVNLWLKVDLRAKWGRFPEGKARSSRRTYHLRIMAADAGRFRFRGASCADKRRAVHQALGYLEKKAEELRFFVDLSAERLLAEHLDFDGLFRRPDPREIGEDEAQSIDQAIEFALDREDER